MNFKIASVVVCLLWCQSAAAKCEVEHPGKFANEFAVAFQTGTLAALDKKYCLASSLQVIFQHATKGSVYEQTAVRSFRQLDQWLAEQRKKRGITQPMLWPFKGCRRGSCGFASGTVEIEAAGTLYLTDLHYETTKSGVLFDTATFVFGE